MKILTEDQIKEMKRTEYNRGFHYGRLNALNELMLTSVERVDVNCFCEYLVDELIELSYNTWDQDRINSMIDLIKNKQNLWRRKTDE